MGQIYITVNLCEVCGHRWLSEGSPKRCAKCKSSKWNDHRGGVDPTEREDWETAKKLAELDSEAAEPIERGKLDGPDDIIRTVGFVRYDQGMDISHVVDQIDADIEQELSSLGPKATATRKEKKAEKGKRKAELHRKVRSAISAKPEKMGAALGRSTRQSVDLLGGGHIFPAIAGPKPGQRLYRDRKPKAGASKEQPAVGSCVHPAEYRTGGKNWKCTACGYPHKG